MGKVGARRVNFRGFSVLSRRTPRQGAVATMNQLISLAVAFEIFAGATGLLRRSTSPREKRLKNAVLLTSACAALFLSLAYVIGPWLEGGRLLALTFLALGFVLYVPLLISLLLFASRNRS